MILLPDDLFYNTNAAGIILLLSRNKSSERRGQILLVNASAYFVKKKPKNELTADGITTIAEVYRNWETREKLSRVISLEEARKADYSLSPLQFVEISGEVQHRSIGDILADLDRAGIERDRADEHLRTMLKKIGFR